MSYRIGRGKQGVLTFEPYEYVLLPLWRFSILNIARESAQGLWERFIAYNEMGDFVVWTCVGSLSRWILSVAKDRDAARQGHGKVERAIGHGILRKHWFSAEYTSYKAFQELRVTIKRPILYINK